MGRIRELTRSTAAPTRTAGAALSTIPLHHQEQQHMIPPIAFVDCETTHLDASIGEAWEVAVILREQDGEQTTDTEYVWQFAPDTSVADPEALRIGRFEERYKVPPYAEAAFTAHESGHITPMTRAEAVTAIVNVLSGAVLVGSNPGFDDRFLRKLLGPGGAQWHYRPYDIVQLAAARIGAQAAGPLPWRAHVLSRAVGVEPPTAEAAHTALGDARWARDVYDAAMVQEKFPLSWEGRAQHAIGLYTKTAIELDDTRRALTEMRTALRDEHENAQAALSRAEGSIARVNLLLDQRWLSAPHGADDHDHVCPDDVRKAVGDALDGPSQPVSPESPKSLFVHKSAVGLGDEIRGYSWDDKATDRFPVAQSVVYIVRGMPEVPDEYTKGLTIAPTEITLTYRAAPDGQLGRIHAYVKGWWMRDGARVPMDKPVGRHFHGDLASWPEWLAAEARLHDPAHADEEQRDERQAQANLDLLAEQICTLDGAMRIVESWFVDVNDGHGLDASDLVHQLHEAGYKLPSDGPS